jgi:hypothetical protein
MRWHTQIKEAASVFYCAVGYGSVVVRMEMGGWHWKIGKGKEQND